MHTDLPELPLRHEALPPRTPTAAPPLLVLLHGYGSNEEDLLQLAPYLPDDCQIVAFRAPLMLSPGANCWYELAFTADGIVGDPRQALHSLEILREAVTAAVKTYTCDPARVAVLGFSQGGGMAGMLALTEPSVRCSLVLSGINPFSIVPAAAIMVANPRVAVFHGTYDEVVPITTGQATHAAFTALGASVTYAEFPIGHTIDMRVLAAISTYLAGAL